MEGADDGGHGAERKCRAWGRAIRDALSEGRVTCQRYTDPAESDTCLRLVVSDAAPRNRQLAQTWELLDRFIGCTVPVGDPTPLIRTDEVRLGAFAQFLERSGCCRVYVRDPGSGSRAHRGAKR